MQLMLGKIGKKSAMQLMSADFFFKQNLGRLVIKKKPWKVGHI
jgi:hypothetical protein